MLQTSVGWGGSNGYFLPKEDKEYTFCKIRLEQSGSLDKICGQVILKPKPMDERSKVRYENCPYLYYGLTVELHATLAVKAGAKGSHIRKELFDPYDVDLDYPLVFKSRIHTLVNGIPEGMMKGQLSFEPRLKLDFNEVRLPFELTLPPDESLPASIVPLTSPNGQLEYALVSYIRTKDGYEELARKQFTFYGHNSINEEQSNVNIKTEHENTENGIKILLESPCKYYLPKEHVEFKLSVMTKKEKECDKYETELEITATASINQVLTFVVDREEKSENHIIHTKTFKKKTRKCEMVSTGKLYFQPTQSSQSFLTLGRSRSHGRRGSKSSLDPVLPTFSGMTLNGYGIRRQYFLQAEITVSPCGGSGMEQEEKAFLSEELHIGTMRTSQTFDDFDPGGLFSRIRSRSRSMSVGSSLFSLFPPPYSSVVSRRGSLETLPPTYDEVDKTMRDEDDA